MFSCSFSFGGISYLEVKRFGWNNGDINVPCMCFWEFRNGMPEYMVACSQCIGDLVMIEGPMIQRSARPDSLGYKRAAVIYDGVTELVKA